MMRWLKVLGTLTVVGSSVLACGESPEQEDPAELSSTSQELFTISQDLLQRSPFIKDVPVFLVTPAWAEACGAPARRFAVLTRDADCARQNGGGGAWFGTARGSSSAGTLCEMSWSPYQFVMPGAPVSPKDPAPPDYAVLARIALDDGRPRLDGHPGIQPLCSGQSVCSEGSGCPSATLASVPHVPVGTPFPIEGMAGCSACGFVEDSTAYLTLPSEWLHGSIGLNVQERSYVLQGTSRIAPSDPSQVTTSLTVRLPTVVADGTPVTVYRR